MSDTPRTDGLTFLAQPGMMPPYNTVPASFARQLERQLTEVTKQRDDIAKALRSLIRLDDQFKDPEYCENGTHEGAYLCFYKGESQTWENTRKALAAVKGGEG